MKYSGRGTLLVLLGVGIIVTTGYDFLAYRSFFYSHAVVATAFIPVCWWLGYRYDKAVFLSEKDALTEIHNRRFVYRTFPKLCSLTDRNSKQLGVLMLDINDFKVINDKYGHKKGDLVLKHISALLQHNTRKSDIVARWGGDEFLIIIPLTSQAGIEAFIKRIQSGLDKLSETIQTGTAISVGSAMYPDDARQLDELVQIADRNMYQFKKGD